MRLVVAFALVCAVACSPKVEYTPLAPAGPPRSLAANVDIYLPNETLPSGAEVLGIVSIGDTGFTTNCGLDRMLTELRDQAREVGADGAYVTEIREPGMSSTCYRLTARLLRYATIRQDTPTAISSDSEFEWSSPIPGSNEVIAITGGDLLLSSAPSAYERILPAVVAIETDVGGGTGFHISADGLTLTNHHVLEGASRVWAVLADGATAPVRVIRSDQSSDVALVQVHCPRLCPTVAMATEAPVPASDVLAVGNPRGLRGSVTRGVVSGVRFFDGVTQIQIDAPINPGSSGGPLATADSGEVIGIVTWKVAGDGSEGLGFAVAIQDALARLGIARR